MQINATTVAAVAAKERKRAVAAASERAAGPRGKGKGEGENKTGAATGPRVRWKIGEREVTQQVKVVALEEVRVMAAVVVVALWQRTPR